MKADNPLLSADGGSLMHAGPDLDLDDILPGHLECPSLHFLLSPWEPTTKSKMLTSIPMSLSEPLPY